MPWRYATVAVLKDLEQPIRLTDAFEVVGVNPHFPCSIQGLDPRLFSAAQKRRRVHASHPRIQGVQIRLGLTPWKSAHQGEQNPKGGCS
jgi:hypothetical protein